MGFEEIDSIDECDKGKGRLIEAGE